MSLSQSRNHWGRVWRRAATSLAVKLICVHFILAPAAAQAQQLSRGHEILLDHGFQLQAEAGPVSGGLNDARWENSNFRTPFLIGTGLHGYSLPSADGYFGRLLTSIGSGNTHLAGEDLSKLVNLQYKDEQPLTTENIQDAANVLAQWRQDYPGTLSYTNQFGRQETKNTLRTYMQTAQPDMLMFDTYPFQGDFPVDGYAHWYRHLDKYRILGLEGNDGTGNKPIPTGVYLQSFEWADRPYTPSESEIQLNQFSAWAFGNKLGKAFFYNDGPAHTSKLDAVLFDDEEGDDNPTAAFYHMAETNRQSRNLGPALVRLLSEDVSFIPGQHYSSANGVQTNNPLYNDGRTDRDFMPGENDPYITNITATNIGEENLDSSGNKLPGDVIVGHFEPLRESFDGPEFEDQNYFMIVNGLSWPDDGTGARTMQEIRIDFDFGESGITSLQRLNRDTGEVEVVPLVHDGGSLYHLDLTLEGGTGDLFKFNTGAPFVVPEPSSAACMGIGVSLAALRRGRRRALHRH